MLETVKDESKKSHEVPNQSRTNKTLNKVSREQINWSPLGGSSSNYASYKLVKVSLGRLEVKKATVNIVFSLIFILVGFIWIFVVYPDLLSALGGIIFIAVGAWPFYKPNTGVFDKDTGQFWFDCNKLRHSSDYAEHRLSKVAAVQVTEEYITSSDDGDSVSYCCYELNLVMENGKRHNVMRHGGKEMHEDGQKLAQFLDVPYFD